MMQPRYSNLLPSMSNEWMYRPYTWMYITKINQRVMMEYCFWIIDIGPVPCRLLIPRLIDIDAIAVANIFAVYLHGSSCHWTLLIHTVPWHLRSQWHLRRHLIYFVLLINSSNTVLVVATYTRGHCKTLAEKFVFIFVSLKKNLH